MTPSKAAAGSAPLILLGASIVLTVALAWQAFSSATSHRALAERVLRDYAELAASEFSRRSTAFVGNYGVVVGLRAISQAARDNSGALPSRAAVAAAMSSQSRRAQELVGMMVQFDESSGRFVTDGAELPPQVKPALMDAARERRLNDADFIAIHPTIDGHTRLYVVTPASVGDRAEAWLGFEVSMDAVRAWIEEFVAADSLLPPALVSSEAARRAMKIVVRAPDGAIVFDSRDSDARFAPTAVRDLAGAPAVSGLGGFLVEVAIDPAAASSLIIGGVPKSQLAFVVVLLVLSAALACAAAVQIRRERRHAQMRQDFVTRASHELRTPVARIRMFTETLLLDRVRSEAERQQTLQALDRGARRLSLVIDNVLQLSRAERSAAIHREPVDVRALVEDVVREFESSVDVHEVIEVAAPSSLIVDVDGEALRQVLLNLLDNAWKYGGSPPTVRVEVRDETDHLTLNVDDNGRGVPERDRMKIWEPYVRLERDRQSSIAGTGIGLAVVKDLVGRHGGRSYVDSSAAGGARFSVTFPVGGRFAAAAS
jgi:signal transduction histidine kinase